MIPCSGPCLRGFAPRGLLPIALAAALVAAAGATSPIARAGDPSERRAAGPDGRDDGGDPGDDAESRLRDRLVKGPRAPGAETVRAWARETAAEGRARRGTDLGGDLLSGAASALETRGLDLGDALGLVREAISAYPPGRAAVGFAWFELAVILGRTGDPAGALAALDEAVRIAGSSGALDAPADDAVRRAALAAQLAGLGQEWRADLLTALGRHAEAATIHEGTARARSRSRGGRGASGADAAYERAAISAQRAGDPERAMANVDAAIEAAPNDARLVDLSQWRLYARHGALDAQGAVRLTDAWPGRAFLEEARTTLHRLEGRAGAWRLAMQVASSAAAASRMAQAVEMYEIAFRDPSFEMEARSSSLARQRILTAALVALRAGDPARARAWLELAVRFAGGPIAGTEGLSLAIDEALTQAEVARVSGRATPGEEPPGEGALPKRGGELVVPELPSGDDDGDGDPRAAPSGPARHDGSHEHAIWLAAALASVGALALGFALALAARRRARACGTRATGAQRPEQGPKDEETSSPP